MRGPVSGADALGGVEPVSSGSNQVLWLQDTNIGKFAIRDRCTKLNDCGGNSRRLCHRDQVISR
jgi:hypothetical protein